MSIPYRTGAVLLILYSMATPATPQDSTLLAPCPDRPNCVSSQAADARHAIEPLSYTGDAQVAWKILKTIVAKQPRTRITRENDRHLQAECRSLVFRFVDDLEFLLDPEHARVQVRSAARTGYSDFGVNRRRVERIRHAFTEALDARAR